MQNVCRAEAALKSFMDERLALLQGAKAEADRALARLQREHARAQALVRAHGPPSIPLPGANVTLWHACITLHSPLGIMHCNLIPLICTGGANNSSTGRGGKQAAEGGLEA